MSMPPVNDRRRHVPVLERYRMDGKVAIVTGASSGLGVEMAQALAEAGADLVVAARREEGIQITRELVEKQGRRCLGVRCDVASVDECGSVVDAAMSEFGRVDVLVNNAGISGASPATREDPDHFRHIFEVNLHGSYWMAQACGRVMRSGSSIINVSSVLGYRYSGIPQAAYVSSKAAIRGLTIDLAGQWTGRKGIRVNALVPGYFPSEMTALMDADELRAIGARTPMGRLGKGYELASAMLFLASDASSYVTGTSLVVDGGLLIQ